MASELAPGVGESLGGYTIESELARGGMGTVFLATHARLERKVALKVITPGLAGDEEFRARFLRESQLAASLDHPNVIPIYDADEADGVLYLAMRYVAGPSLQELLTRRGRLSPEETLGIVEQVAGALDAAHRSGLVHRDVKPGNVLLAEPDGHAYLCDFGLARRAGSSELTRTGFFLGSVDYCAPEQILGKPLDGRADVYSLGCVVYHCLTGERPYARDGEVAALEAHLHAAIPAPSALRPDLPRAVDGVVAASLAKRPAARPATAGGLAASLGQALAGAATRAAPLPAATAGAPTVGRRRRRRWLLGAAPVALALLALAAALALREPPAETPAEPELRTFVDRVENLLEQSAQGRREVAAALSAGFACSLGPGEAGRRIGSVADNRQSVLGQLGGLQGPTDTANQALTLLQRALQESVEADRHYRDGFLAAAATDAGCAAPQGSEFAAAREADDRATRAKQAFTRAFNGLARRFQRRTWSAREI